MSLGLTSTEAAATTCSSSALPPTLCSTFGSFDLRRVPLPAARTTTAKRLSVVTDLYCVAGVAGDDSPGVACERLAAILNDCRCSLPERSCHDRVARRGLRGFGNGTPLRDPKMCERNEIARDLLRGMARHHPLGKIVADHGPYAERLDPLRIANDLRGAFEG